MKTNEIKVLKAFTNQRRTMPILNQVSISDHNATASDLDSSIRLYSNGISDGCYTITELDRLALGLSVTPSINNEEYPSVFHNDTSLLCSFEPHQLKEILSYLLVSASTDPTRYSLNTICLDLSVHNYNKCLVSCDGMRLRVFELPDLYSVVNKPEEDQFLISTGTAKKLLTAIKLLDPHDTIFVSTGKIEDRTTFMQFECSKFTIETRLVDGKFPDYKQVIPKNFEYSLKLETNKLFLEFLTNCKKIGNKGKNAFNAVKLSLNATGIRLNFKGLEYYKPMYNLGDKTIFETGINLIYLTDAIKHLNKGESYELKLKDSSAPMCFSYGDLTEMIMPMKLE